MQFQPKQESKSQNLCWLPTKAESWYNHKEQCNKEIIETDIFTEKADQRSILATIGLSYLQ